MSAATVETHILEYIKGLPTDCLVEIRDYIQVVRKRALDPHGFDVLHAPEDSLQRMHRLEHRNRYLQYQNALLHEAIETICFAFLNNSKNLDTAIQAAMSLQERARRGDIDPDELRDAVKPAYKPAKGKRGRNVSRPSNEEDLP